MDAKIKLMTKIKDSGFSVHDNTRHLLVSLYELWRQQYHDRDSGNYGKGDDVAPKFMFDGIEPSVKQHEESSDLRTFAMVVAVLGKTLEANTQQYDRVVELVRECKMSGIGSVQ